MSGKMKSIVALSILVTLLLILNPSPQVANAAPKKAVAPKQYITLPAASFVPKPNTDYFLNEMLIGSNQSDGNFYAPIVLPEGATLIRINIFYKDDNGAGTVRAEMKQVKLATGISYSLDSVESGEVYSSPYVEKMTIYLKHTVNRYNAYTLFIQMDFTCRIYGARVIYTMP